jgi:hypothetical protein
MFLSFIAYLTTLEVAMTIEPQIIGLMNEQEKII